MAIENPWNCDMAELEREAFAEPVKDELPAEVQQIRKSFEEFHSAVGDFQITPENVAALNDYVKYVDAAGKFRAPTPSDFFRGHATAIHDGRYKPGPKVDTDPATMPLNELRNLAHGLPQRTAPEPTLQELHDQAFPKGGTE